MRAGYVIIHFVGAAMSAYDLFVALESRVPLRLVLGTVFLVVCLGLGLATFLGAHHLLRGFAAIRRGDPSGSAVYSLRALFVLAVGGWLAILLLAQPPERLWILITAGLVFGAWYAWLALRPAFARLPSSARRLADVSCFSLAASVVLLELALRLAGGWTSSSLLARYGDLPEVVLDRLRRKPGEMFLGSPCNSLGHYDDEPRRRRPGDHLVASIGDSFSLGVVPHAMNYTTVCEWKLGVPVQNFGIAATGPPEYLRILVDEALPLDPDLISIGVFVGNDLTPLPDDTLRLPDSLRDWLDRDSVLLWLVPRRLATMAEERRLVGGEESLGSPQGSAERRRGPVEVLFPWTADPSLEQPTFSKKNFLHGEVHRARTTSRLDRASLGNFFAAMRTMQQAAGSIPLCVLLIPDEFQVEDDVWRDVLDASGGEALVRDRAQELLVPWFSENGVACLDLLPIFRAVPAMPDGRKHLYHLRDTHWNARGNRVAGEALAEFLAPKLTRADGERTR